MTKPPNIEGEVSPPPSDSDEGLSSAPVNQMIQLDTDTQSSSANGQSKIPKLDSKQETPASVSAPENRGLDFFDNYINPDPQTQSHPLLSLYQEIPAQEIKINPDLRSSESHPLLSLYQEIPAQEIKINSDPQPQSHPLLSLYKEIKPAQTIKTNSDLRSSESHPLLSLYKEMSAKSQ